MQLQERGKIYLPAARTQTDSLEKATKCRNSSMKNGSLPKVEIPNIEFHSAVSTSAKIKINVTIKTLYFAGH